MWTTQGRKTVPGFGHDGGGGGYDPGDDDDEEDGESTDSSGLKSGTTGGIAIGGALLT